VRSKSRAHCQQIACPVVGDLSLCVSLSLSPSLPPSLPLVFSRVVAGGSAVTDKDLAAAHPQLVPAEGSPEMLLTTIEGRSVLGTSANETSRRLKRRPITLGFVAMREF
jgi:hypothetical protein